MGEIEALIRYYLAAEVLGLLAIPITSLVFARFPDKGWGFSKIVGIILPAWLVWLVASLHLQPFGYTTILVIGLILGIVSLLILTWRLKEIVSGLRSAWGFILIEEILFISVLIIWTFMRGFSPDTNGLEKFMDYGFMVSAMKATYFPPLDHFFARESINYYYFGHYLAGFITTVAKVPPQFGYNLQMSLIFALGVVESFAIGSALFFLAIKDEAKRIPWRSATAGILSAFLVNLTGNLHTIAHYFQDPKKYWYPDATRYIANTIHEFPIYSYIVNDLHGHVSDIPIVLLGLSIIAVIIFNFRQETDISPINRFKTTLPLLAFLGFVIGTMYATNAWDFAIYLVVTGLALWTLNSTLHRSNSFFARYFDLQTLVSTALQSATVMGIAILLYLPFWLDLVPISKGIGIVPFGAQTPPWQWWIVWGVHIPLALVFIYWLRNRLLNQHGFGLALVQLISKFGNFKISLGENSNSQPVEDTTDSTLKLGNLTIPRVHVFLTVIIIVALLLSILPEIIFMRDIYPTHYRANTMFKFFYQAWMMLGIVGGVTTIILWNYVNKVSVGLRGWIYRVISIVIIVCGLMYPSIAIQQGFDLKNPRKSIDGTAYLDTRYPEDALAIDWINENITNQPTFAEAVGDSYTDYARIAANTGNPSVLGWPVHEWLWRGDYSKPVQPLSEVQNRTGELDSVGQRVEDIRILYETSDPIEAMRIVDKYQIAYIYLGTLERQKYEKLNSAKFAAMPLTKVYTHDQTVIYKVN